MEQLTLYRSIFNIFTGRRSHGGAVIKALSGKTKLSPVPVYLKTFKCESWTFANCIIRHLRMVLLRGGTLR